MDHIIRYKLQCTTYHPCFNTACPCKEALDVVTAVGLLETQLTGHRTDWTWQWGGLRLTSD